MIVAAVIAVIIYASVIFLTDDRLDCPRIDQGYDCQGKRCVCRKN